MSIGYTKNLVSHKRQNGPEFENRRHLLTAKQTNPRAIYSKSKFSKKTLNHTKTVFYPKGFSNPKK